MSILIGADVVPTGNNNHYFINGDLESLVGTSLAEIIENADYHIYNVETPLTNVVSPIPKCGPNLIASTNTINGYKCLKANLVTLANNHILDQGEQGLLSTLNCFLNEGIDCIGVGKGTEEARKPFYFCYAGKRIGVYACAEHEFSIVKEKQYGANPFDPLESLDHIEKASNDCDFLIVLYHGGKEYHRYPSPQLIHTCHRMVEKGASLVICQHSHCIGCEEDYYSGKIVYGQGNFIFDGAQEEYWQTGLLVEIDACLKVSYIPLQKRGACVRLAYGDEGAIILRDFATRSEQIKKDDFVKSEYKRRADEMIISYLLDFGCINRRNIIYRGLNRLTGFGFYKWLINRRFTKQRLLTITNFIECEAHRELLLEGMKDIT